MKFNCTIKYLQIGLGYGGGADRKVPNRALHWTRFSPKPICQQVLMFWLFCKFSTANKKYLGPETYQTCI